VSIANRLLRSARRFRPMWALYNLRHYKQLRRNRSQYQRLGVRRTTVGSISHGDIRTPSDEVPWLDRSDAVQALRSHPELESFPEALRRGLLGWPENGYLIAPAFLSGDEVDAINDELERLMADRAVTYHYRGNRVMDAHRESRTVANVVKREDLVRLLSFILGRDVILFQTINFFEGSEQAAHSDFFHMTTEPLGYLIAIWIALEDVTPGSGPVYYYPGSHRLPYVLSEHLDVAKNPLLLDPSKEDRYSRKIAEVAREVGIEPVEFLAKKGDLLVWHANLIHGGRAIENAGATRKSLVAHYFGKDVLCYHEVTERPALVEA
jgi:ectoine hydroxylase